MTWYIRNLVTENAEWGNEFADDLAKELLPFQEDEPIADNVNSKEKGEQ